MPRFVPNRNFARELEREPSYTQGLATAAQPAADIAKAIARAEAYDEGDYEESIEVKIIDGKVYLRSTDFKANWIERGSVKNPVSAPLQRGARGAGLRLQEE